MSVPNEIFDGYKFSVNTVVIDIMHVSHRVLGVDFIQREIAVHEESVPDFWTTRQDDKLWWVPMNRFDKIKESKQ